MSQAAVTDYAPTERAMTLSSAQKSRPKLTVTATYTAEPLGDFLSYWLGQVGLGWDVEFAAYQQVFQELLDPGSLSARNRDGVVAVLLRVEDFLRYNTNGSHGAKPASDVDVVVDELLAAIKGFAAQRSKPLLVVLHEPSRSVVGAPSEPCRQATNTLRSRLTAVPNVVLLGDADWLRSDVGEVFDDEQNALGHIPFSTPAFAALATTLIRKVHMLTTTARKVLVLDCDNTLWGGVVGEDGPAGLTLGPQHVGLQRFAAGLADQGIVIALCSKNVESDVDAAFNERSDFVLQRRHIVTQRVNWLPKSENIRAMATELNLGLDSFVFIDDNPVECAEVQAALPMVLTLRFPSDQNVAERMVANLWAFDRLAVTAEDKMRTEAYKKNAERKRFQEQSGSLGDFIAGLNLQIGIEKVSPDAIARVSQLTQRTNQFNTTTLRRSEAEVAQLEPSGTHCFCVRVSDRFGDYGLVGVMTCRAGVGLDVDSLMLSCRVLGRGVEHAMVRRLGELALAEGLRSLVIPVVTSARNQPILTFLDGVASDYRQATDKGWLYTLPADVAATMSYTPASFEDLDQSEGKQEPQKAAVAALAGGMDVSAVHAKIACELATAQAVVDAVARQQQRLRPQEAVAVAANTDVERALLSIWQECLQVQGLGVEDDFFAAGGTSVLAVRVLAEAQRQLGVSLPLSSVLEAPTVRLLSQRINPTWQRRSLVRLRQGNSTGPHFFFVHDGLGETLLYANIVQKLPRGMAAYGIEPTSGWGVPLAHATIEQMAAKYVELAREAQPKGPYFLGGLCAGGTIAWEMARQLSESGERVALVAMFDNAAPGAAHRRGRVARMRVERFASLFNLEHGLTFGNALKLAATARDKMLRAASYELSMRFNHRRSQFLHLALGVALRQHIPWPAWLPSWSVQQLYDRAEGNYRPSPSAPAERVVLFRASEGEGLDTPYKEIYEDESLGWRQLVRTTFTAVDVPGGHGSMLQEPHAQVLGTQLAQLVQELSTRSSG